MFGFNNNISNNQLKGASSICNKTQSLIDIKELFNQYLH